MAKINLIAVTGADSGLGLAIFNALSKEEQNAVIPIPGPNSANGLDLTQDASIYAVGQSLRKVKIEMLQELGYVASDIYCVLINCAGINYIDWFDQAMFRKYDELMNLNLKVPLMLTQELIGIMPPTGPDVDNWFGGSGAVLNIISNASHVAMTNSVFYNASKGALHIATLALARELRKTHGLNVFGISPNKLKGTGMSAYIEGAVPGIRGWTPEQAASYQLGALPAGEETDPDVLAEFISFLLSHPDRHKYLTNTVIPYGA